MPCKHSDKMMIYAKQAAEMDEPWKLWDAMNNCESKWVPLKAHPKWDKGTTYRVRPKTIRIGNYDVPEPMREKPEMYSTYYFIRLDVKGGYLRDVWANEVTDNRRLEAGICQATESGIIAHAKALFSFSEVK